MNLSKLLQVEAVVGQHASEESTALQLHWWQLPNVLSLDAVTIAISWYALIALSLGQHVAWGNFAVLGLSTWLVYVADHWLDAARSASGQWQPVRHSVFMRERKGWLCLWLAVLALDVLLALEFVDHAFWRRGAGLTLIVLLYIGGVHAMHWRLPKDWIVSAVFAASPFIMLHTFPMPDLCMLSLFTGFWLVVAANCLLLNQWEADAGGTSNASSRGQWCTTSVLALITSICLLVFGGSSYLSSAMALLLSAFAVPIVAISSSKLKLPYELRHPLLDYAFGFAVVLPLLGVLCCR